MLKHTRCPSMLVLSLLAACSGSVGPLDGGAAAGSATAGGGTAGGATAGGATAGGATAGGATAGGATAGGAATADGGRWDGGFPFALPTPGNALFIGTNKPDSVRPSPLGAGEWEYSLFNCYTGGVYVRDFSPGGAYVFAATGGHNCPPNVGAALFDFADATWKRLDNANGVPWRSAEYTPSEVNGELEIATSGATPNAVPAPFHTYQLLAPLPAARGGGSQGSVVTVVTQFATTQASSSGRSHRFDLATRTWSRFSTGTSPYTGFTAIFDPAATRFYVLPNEIHSVQQLSWLDGLDSTWKTSSLGTWPATDGANNTSFIEPTHHLLVMQSTTSHLRAIDLADTAAGVRLLTVTGTLPACTDTRWERDDDTGAFYTYCGTGQLLYKLQPPASAPLTSAWVVSTVAVTGVTLPPHVDTGNGSGHYTRFFYVPPLHAFAWIGDYDARVVLLSP